MDPELSKKLKDKQDELARVAKELNALMEQSVSEEYRGKELSPDLDPSEMGPYRTPGKVLPDEPKKKERKPLDPRKMLDRALGPNRLPDHLFDRDEMKRQRKNAHSISKRADAVETLRLYEELLQLYEAFPPCTLNAKEYLECATFKRGVKK